MGESSGNVPVDSRLEAARGRPVAPASILSRSRGASSDSRLASVSGPPGPYYPEWVSVLAASERAGWIDGASPKFETLLLSECPGKLSTGPAVVRYLVRIGE